MAPGGPVKLVSFSSSYKPASCVISVVGSGTESSWVQPPERKKEKEKGKEKKKKCGTVIKCASKSLP